MPNNIIYMETIIKMKTQHRQTYVHLLVYLDDKIRRNFHNAPAEVKSGAKNIQLCYKDSANDRITQIAIIFNIKTD